MPEPALGLKTSLLNGGSFLKRIHENLISVCNLPWMPLPAAQAPIRLLDDGRSKSPSASQIGSALAHACLCAAFVWTVTRPPQDPLTSRHGRQWSSLPSIPKWVASPGNLGKSGQSGGPDKLPPNLGELPPESRVALVGPHLSDSRPHPLAVQITTANPEAPEFVRMASEVGLPWMLSKNGSESSGKNGIGDGKDHGMGIGPCDGVGVGNDGGPYGPITSEVICGVCPDPLYSEEARKSKLQGTVLLSVLVGADGRAKDVRVLRGLGMGLDENAIQAIRNWQFIPAKDAAQRRSRPGSKSKPSFGCFRVASAKEAQPHAGPPYLPAS